MTDLPGTLGDLLLGVDHVGVAVADLDAAVSSYEQLFGLVTVHQERNDGQGVVEAMLVVPGASGDGTQLQLLAPTSSESAVARFLDRRGPGLQHLALRVRDVHAAAAVLLGRGVRLLYDAPRTGTHGSLINFVHPHDAGGVLIELVEPAAGRR